MPPAFRLLVSSDPLVMKGLCCPYDGSPFQPGEGIVVCDVCNTAHHINCWQSNGNRCTRLGCPGAGDITISITLEEDPGTNMGSVRPAAKWYIYLYIQVNSGPYYLTVDQKGIIAKSLAKLKNKPIHMQDQGTILVVGFETSASTVVDAHLEANQIIEILKPQIEPHSMYIPDYFVKDAV